MSNQSRAGSLKHVSITQRLPSDDTLTHGAPHAQLADPRSPAGARASTQQTAPRRPVDNIDGMEEQRVIFVGRHLVKATMFS